MVGAINNEFGFLQKSLPLPDVPTHSDTEGLNLNITVPLGPNGTLQADAKLPVYVFIHGGAFAFGSSWYPHYDAAAIVRLSVEMGKPIIGVTIKCVLITQLTCKSSKQKLDHDSETDIPLATVWARLGS